MNLTTAIAPERRAVTELARSQQQLVEALAAADHAAVLAATAEMRLALRALERLPAGTEANAMQEMLKSNDMLREATRARLTQARQALDALGLHCNSFNARGQSSYQPR